MTVTEMKRAQVKSTLRALRFYYNKVVDVDMKVPKWWLREKLEGYEHYDEWFDGMGLPFLMVYVLSPYGDGENDIIRITATGKSILEYVEKYGGPINYMRIYKY